MAKILEFRACDLECDDRAPEIDSSKSAEVILFPGVRYERQDAEIANGQASQHAEARAPQRDVLELAE